MSSRRPFSRSFLARLAVAAVVGYLASVGFAAAADGPATGAVAPPVDHSNHVHQEPAAGATMDAAADHDHGDHQDHSMASGDDDPHAQHKAMMRQQGYQRSEHAYTLEDLPLVGMDGKPTSLLAELDADKPVMVNFVFTTCTTICPVMTGIFAQVQKQLGPERDDVRMISVSIDPEYDTPERLREYAKRFDAGPQWRFLTGDLRNIIGVQRAFDVYRGNKMSHEPTTLMRRSSGDPWVRLDGIASAADITSEYRALVGR